MLLLLLGGGACLAGAVCGLCCAVVLVLLGKIAVLVLAPVGVVAMGGVAGGG